MFVDHRMRVSTHGKGGGRTGSGCTSGSIVSFFNSRISICPCQVTQVAKGSSPLSESLNAVGHGKIPKLSHMVRWSSSTDWGWRYMVAVKPQTTVVVYRGETLSFPIVARFMLAVILQTMHGACTHCSVMTRLELSHGRVCARALAFDKEVGYCWSAPIIARHNMLPKIAAYSRINLFRSCTIVSVRSRSR